MDLDTPDEIAVATWLNGTEFAKVAVDMFARCVKSSARQFKLGNFSMSLFWDNCFAEVTSEVDDMPPVLRSALFIGSIRRPLDSIPAIIKLVEGGNLARILLHACVDPPVGKSMQYSAKHHHKAFNRTYYGTAAENFNTALHNTYSEIYQQGRHYGRIISIFQSSATGKSRLVKELGNLIPTLSICLRKPGDTFSAWPPGDDPVYEYFRDNIDNHKGEELAAAFLGALVTTVKDMLPVHDRKEPRTLLKAWELDTPDLPTNSTRHKNFVTVCALAKQNLSAAKEAMVNIRLSITPNSSIRTAETPRVTVDWYADLYGLFCDQPFGALAEELRRNGHDFFLIAFDGCTALNLGENSGPKTRSPKYHMSLIALQLIIKAADNAEFATPGVQFWYPFLDTSSAIVDLYPRRGEESWRLLQFDPLPPWPHMGFDQLLQEEYNRFSGTPNPHDVLSFEHLKHYGRPYWVTVHTADVLHAAQRKLFGSEVFLAGLTDHVFAAFSRRLCLETTNAEAASRLSAEAVRGHMRYARGVINRAFIVTSAPSEPMLSLAAADALSTTKTEGYQKALGTFFRHLIVDAPLIEQGLKGELLSQLLLTMARDVISVISDDRQSVKPVTLEGFLAALLGAIIVPQALDAYCTGGHINFTHFVQSNEDFAIITPDFLYYCWCRGTAIQCSYSQLGISGIIPCYWGSLDPNQPFDKNKLGMLAYQTNPKIEAASQALEDSLTCPCLCENPESPTSLIWKPRHVMLLMDLGTSRKFQSAQQDYCRIAFKAPVAPAISRWKAYLPDERARWCIAVRGYGSNSYPHVVNPKLESLFRQLLPRDVQLHAEREYKDFEQYQTAGDKATATHSTLDQERCKFAQG